MRERYFTHTGDGLLVFEDTIVSLMILLLGSRYRRFPTIKG